MSFVHLHNHSHYSLLDSTSKIKPMLSLAAKLGMNALALTDHGNLFGALEFYTEALKVGIKPILGMEAYIAPRERQLHKAVEGEPYFYHLILLAKNKTGFRNLIKLSSIGYLEGMYYKPRIDKNILNKYSEGLIASTACLKGEIPYKLQNGQREQAIKAAEEYLRIFGNDFYFEIQEHKIPQETAVFQQVYNLAKEMDIPVIATNNNHYLDKSNHDAHDILLCLQTGKDRDDLNRMRYDAEEFYLKSPDEMFRLFRDKPEVLEHTLEIEEKINLEIDFNKSDIPKFSIPESEGSIKADEFLRRLVYKGAEKRYEILTSEIIERMEFELDVIKHMGYADYFLITRDFIQTARKKDIPGGLGHGSISGSIVSYNLEITDVDPLKYDLLFEKFLNPEIPSIPYIDIDIPLERYDELINYVREKYGSKNVARIITFGTLTSKSVIREVSRVLKIPAPTVDSITKWIPAEKYIPLEQVTREVPEIKKIVNSEYTQIQELFKYALTLEGIVYHTAIQAASIIITPKETDNYIPLYKTSNDEIAVQWAKGWSKKTGFLKLNLWSQRYLTVLHKIEKMINAHRGGKFEIGKIPIDDAKTFKLFSDGLTVGVFQFEISGIKKYLKMLKPSCIKDLIAINALYRSSTMSMLDDFIDRKYGRKKIAYLHPSLEPILKETYGMIVYQEQVMRIIVSLLNLPDNSRRNL